MRLAARKTKLEIEILEQELEGRDEEVNSSLFPPKYTTIKMDILLLCIVAVWVIGIPIFIRYLYLARKKKRLMKELDDFGK